MFGCRFELMINIYHFTVSKRAHFFYCYWSLRRLKNNYFSAFLILSLYINHSPQNRVVNNIKLIINKWLLSINSVIIILMIGGIQWENSMWLTILVSCIRTFHEANSRDTYSCMHVLCLLNLRPKLPHYA